MSEPAKPNEANKEEPKKKVNATAAFLNENKSVQNAHYGQAKMINDFLFDTVPGLINQFTEPRGTTIVIPPPSQATREEANKNLAIIIHKHASGIGIPPELLYMMFIAAWLKGMQRVPSQQTASKGDNTELGTSEVSGPGSARDSDYIQARDGENFSTNNGVPANGAGAPKEPKPSGKRNKKR